MLPGICLPFFIDGTTRQCVLIHEDTVACQVLAAVGTPPMAHWSAPLRMRRQACGLLRPGAAWHATSSRPTWKANAARFDEPEPVAPKLKAACLHFSVFCDAGSFVADAIRRTCFSNCRKGYNAAT